MGFRAEVTTVAGTKAQAAPWADGRPGLLLGGLRGSEVCLDPKSMWNNSFV